MTTQEVIYKTAEILETLRAHNFSSPESTRSRKMLDSCRLFTASQTKKETARTALNSANRALANSLCVRTEDEENPPSMSPITFADNLLDINRRMSIEKGKWEALEFVIFPGGSLAK